MKTTLFALFFALLMVGCGEADLSDPKALEDTTADAVDWSKLQDRDGVIYLTNTDKPFSGYAKRAYENEQIEVLAQFKDGYVVRLKQWQENGNPKWDIGFMEGKVGIEGMPYKREPKLKEYGHGPVTAWHENGQKKLEVNVKDGKLDGLWTGWYENGNKEGEANLKNGKVDGLKAEWYENGNKKSEETYKEGKKDRFDSWYENGNKRATSTFKNEKMMTQTRWKPNGEKCPVTNVVNGNGVVVVYEEDGTERVRLTFKNGEPVLD